MNTTTASWEIHCDASSDFTKKGFGRKVKAVGGHFSKCRGYCDKRFVHIPDTPEGREVADAVIAAFPHYGKTTIISRGVIKAVRNDRPEFTRWYNMAWVEVQYIKGNETIADARAKCEKAAQQAVSRGYVDGYEFATAA